VQWRCQRSVQSTSYGCAARDRTGRRVCGRVLGTLQKEHSISAEPSCAVLLRDLPGERRMARARPADGRTRVSPNNEAVRPDKGRDYTERGGAHPAVTFDSYAALARPRNARIRSECKCSLVTRLLGEGQLKQALEAPARRHAGDNPGGLLWRFLFVGLQSRVGGWHWPHAYGRADERSSNSSTERMLLVG